MATLSRRTRILAPAIALGTVLGLTGIGASGDDPADQAEQRSTAERKRPGPDPTGAAEWLHAQRANADGKIPRSALKEAFAQSAAMGQAATRSSSTDQVWSDFGPSNVGGRLIDVAADPTTPNLVYAAAAGGGVWKSTDGGQTFEEAWTTEGSQVMGALTVDSKGVVWAATGEPSLSSSGLTYYGNGIFKSSDQGKTWTHMGLPESATVGRIVVDPSNDQRVFVAVVGTFTDASTDPGLYLTEDGGKTWDRVLKSQNPSTGVVDVAVSPADPKVMLATSWDIERAEKPRSPGPHSYLYRSTDAGKTWTKSHSAPLPQSEQDPAKQTMDNVVGRMGVAFSPSDPKRAYLISSTGRGDFNGLFASTDAGSTWTQAADTASQKSLRSSSGGFAWWFGRLYVNPTNPEHLFSAGVSLGESLNGGVTWTMGSAMHADQHGMAFDPHRPERVYLGNDGGFYWSDKTGAAKGLWRKTPKFPITQFYSIDVSEQDPRRVNGGAQDNYSLKSWSSKGETNGDWFAYHSGDGLTNRIDPTNHHRYIGCYQYGGCQGFDDTTKATWRMSVPGRVNWLTPVEYAADPRYVFSGSERINRMDTTAQKPAWTAISPDLTDGPQEDAPNAGTITAIGTTTADPNLVYAGTDSGDVWVSRNAMAAADQVTWSKIDSPTFPGRWVTRITVDPDNAKVAWATFSGWRDSDPYPHVVMTSDGGKTWSDIVGKKLPQAPVNDVIRHPSKPKWLFIATDVGVFRTTNLGKTWNKVGANLPAVAITDIDLPGKGETLYAATYGRGVWTTSLADAD